MEIRLKRVSTSIARTRVANGFISFVMYTSVIKLILCGFIQAAEFVRYCLVMNLRGFAVP